MSFYNIIIGTCFYQCIVVLFQKVIYGCYISATKARSGRAIRPRADAKVADIAVCLLNNHSTNVVPVVLCFVFCFYPIKF